jgi:hypothetical protein
MNEHWTDIEKKALKNVATLEETAEIAIAILIRMKQLNGHKVIAICGPMSTGGLGNLQTNMCRFRRAIAIASKNGLVVFDQTPFQEAIIRVTGYKEGVEYCVDILEVFYRKIFESGHISKALFLPRWQTSKGASWERQLLASLKIPIEEYPEEWLTLL